MSTELSIAAAYIRAKITGDETLSAAVGTRVYEEYDRKKAGYPCIIFSCSDPSDTVAVGGNTVKSDLFYTIRVIGRDVAYSELDAIAAQLYTVLHNTNDTANGVLFCGRTKPFQRAYDLNNIHYAERGGVYLIMVQRA